MKVTADHIREFVNKNYVLPARNTSRGRIAIRAGDVHAGMKLKDRMPLVCSALRAKVFETTCRVRFVSESGPHQGAIKVMTFDVLP